MTQNPTSGMNPDENLSDLGQQGPADDRRGAP